MCVGWADVAYAVDLRRALPTVRCGIVDSVPVDRCPSRQSRRGMCPRTAESVRYSRVANCARNRTRLLKKLYNLMEIKRLCFNSSVVAGAA